MANNNILFIYLATLHGMWDLCSLTRDWTHLPCSGNADFFFFSFIGNTFLFFKNEFIFGCIGSSLLCVGFLFSCGEQGLLFIAVRGPLIVVASLILEHRL